jgi:hypothetical protein
MPLDVWHKVYTLVPSLAIGGHYMSYATLHLTYMSCQIDNKYWVTNATHSDINFCFTQMMIALVFPSASSGELPCSWNLNCTPFFQCVIQFLKGLGHQYIFVI